MPAIDYPILRDNGRRRVLLVWLTTITVVPLLISTCHCPNAVFNTFAFTRGIDTVLQSVWGRLRGPAPLTIAIACSVLVLGAWFGSKQHIDNVYVNELPAGETRTEIRRLERNIAGVFPLTVNLQGAENGMKRPEFLQRMATPTSRFGCAWTTLCR